MADQTKIEWADSTFNPWLGCTKVSPACDHCYAESMMDHRYGWVQWGKPGEGNGTRVRTSDANWRKPIQWQNQKHQFFREHGRKRRVFCASLADVFDNQVPDEWRDDLWQLIWKTPHLDWMLLTKRPQNIEKMLPRYWDEIKSWVWLGTTVEDQERANLNIPHLLKHDCAVRFVSCEPLLGPVDLRKYLLRGICNKCGYYGPCSTEGPFTRLHMQPDQIYECNYDAAPLPSIDWIIAGGESGPNARPSHPDWFRSLRDQAATAGVPFLFKQHGEWIPGEVYSIARKDGSESGGHTRCMDGWAHHGKPAHWWSGDAFGGVVSVRIGKKRAGRLLDGVEHNGFPPEGPTTVVASGDMVTGGENLAAYDLRDYGEDSVK